MLVGSVVIIIIIMSSIGIPASILYSFLAAYVAPHPIPSHHITS